MSLHLAELIFQSAARTPDATALVDRDRSLTYAALAADVTGFAHGLAALGVLGALAA